MSRSRALALASSPLIAATAILAAPAAVAAHALGQVYSLPIPLWLYLAGSGTAVAASFVVAAAVARPRAARSGYRVRQLPAGPARAASVLLSVIGLAWWLGTILAGYFADEFSPLPAILFWIGIWVGLPIVSVVLGNPWPSLSPFRALFGLFERIGRIFGLERLDAGLAYPPGLARWPAVALLFATGWAELDLLDGQTPRVVANLLLGYTILTLAGMLLFGRVSWLRNAELFEVLLGWFGRIGPIGRRVVQPDVCEGCEERCDPSSCVDCPECATAAGPADRQPEIRPWFAGLTEVRGAGWSDAAFIILALAIVTYDGLSETEFWGSLMTPFFDALWEALSPVTAVLAVQTGGLAAVWLVFLAAFSLAVWLTHSLRDVRQQAGGTALGRTVGIYASTLLPIAAGYMIAHYLTVLVQAVVWIPTLIADPLATVAPPLDWMPAAAVWYLSVGAIVIGHIVAVVLAHRHALRDSPTRPILAGLPLVLLMIGYTVLSLWIIAAPLTLDPGVEPAALHSGVGHGV
jgi:hypothetical protein